MLKILVGQEGGVNTVSGGAGGGGGSFVVTDDNTPLLIGKCAVENFRQRLGKWSVLFLRPTICKKNLLLVLFARIFMLKIMLRTRRVTSNSVWIA